MNKRVEQLIRDKDVGRLKFVFLDSLDADPTFVNYEEEYSEAKKIPGFFEIHKELTPLNTNNLDEKYWSKIKNDLQNNFSEERFEFMRKAAKIYYSDKVKLIEQQREIEGKKRKLAEENIRFDQEHQNKISNKTQTTPKINLQEKQQQEIEEKKRKLEEENRRFDQAHLQKNTAPIVEEQPPKKQTGAAVPILLALAGILLLVLIIIMIVK